MRRRRVVAGCAGIVTGLAGCGAFSTGPDAGPRPTVRDHVRGDPTVTRTERRFAIDGPQRIVVDVRNDGHDADVELAVYWVPTVDASPEGRSHEELLSAGYRLGVRRRISLAGGASETVVFEAEQPADAAGYYVRRRNLTYGAIVENRGGAGPVTATLVDTSSMDDQRVLDTRVASFDAGERRPVLFTSEEDFEYFRVDVSAGRE